MNRRVIAMLLALPIAAAAKFSFGVDAGFSLNDDIVTSDPDRTALETEVTKLSGLDVSPHVGIYAGEVVEIAPFLQWGLTKYTYTFDDTASNTNDYARTQNHLGLGTGVYFHLVRGDVFGLSIGPQLGYRIYFKPSYAGDMPHPDYDKYYQGDLWLGAPINFDLHVHKHVTLRLGATVFRFNYTTHSYEQPGEDPDVAHEFGLDLQSILSPSFGLEFVF
jgi:hypothetical protein